MAAPVEHTLRDWTLLDENLLWIDVFEFARGRLCSPCARPKPRSAKKFCRSSFSFEQDLTLCREAIEFWWRSGGPSLPPERWFEENVVGQNPLLEGIHHTVLSHRFKEHIYEKLVSSVISHKSDWSVVQVYLGWLKKQHGLREGQAAVTEIVAEGPRKKLKEG